MEDQGKRLLMAVAAAFGIVLLWNVLFPPEPPTRDTPQDEIAEPSPPVDRTPTPDGRGPDDRGRTPQIAHPDEPGVVPAEEVTAQRGPEELFELDFPGIRAVFTNHGGNLKSWELKGKKYQATKNGVARQINLVHIQEEGLLPFALRFQDIDWDSAAAWTGTRKSDTEVEFRWQYQVRSNDGGSVVAFELVKTYKIYPDDYLLELVVDIVNHASADERQALTVSLFGYQDPREDTGGGWTQVESSWKSACYINGDLSETSAESLTGGNRKLRTGQLKWGGFQHSYFLIAAAPRESSPDFRCNSYGVEGRAGVMQTDIVFPTVNMRRGGPPTTHAMVAYLGPKYLDTLDATPQVVGFDPKFSASIDLGWFEFIAKPMLYVLQWFYSFLGNWGLAIIFLTVLVKLLTLYWTTKSMRSMKAMARLKPQIEALQKKYKDDKQRQQVEVMNLYKAHKVNPLAGCLPILLQMPIWFALYRMLMAAAELYNAPFIPGWIDDLTSTDPYYILPIALVGLMLLQARLSPTPADSMQQKIMMYGLPLTFGVFSFFFPAGLTLYIATNTVLTALHHLWINRNDPPPTRGKDPAGDKATAPGSAKRDRKADEGDDGDEAEDRDDSAAEDRSGKKSREPGSKPRARGQQRRKGGKRKRGGGGQS